MYPVSLSTSWLRVYKQKPDSPFSDCMRAGVIMMLFPCSIADSPRRCCSLFASDDMTCETLRTERGLVIWLAYSVLLAELTSL